MSDGLRLTIVGSGAAWARRPGHASSCYLVEHGEDAIVLDLGQGSFAALSGYRDPASVRALFVSHLHPDHGVDVVPLRHYLRYEVRGERTLELHAPAGFRARYDALLGEEGFLRDLPTDDLRAGQRTVGPFDVAIEPVTHALESHGFRVSLSADPGGPGLVYSGDCGRADDLLALLRPGDTLLCEAYFGAEDAVPAAGHLDARLAGEVAAAGGAARLVLTHIRDGADRDAARRRAEGAFDGPVALAEPGLRIDIP